MNGLTIGKVARGAGLGIETVRFYEREGLLEPPKRTAANYRIYPQQDIIRLRFIKRAKNLGFTLKEIRDLLSLRQDPKASKEDVKRQTEAKIADIEQKIHDLTRIKQTLERLDQCCDGHGPTSDCPILEALESGNGLDLD
jgi:Hg(II)-responsive transcriptional regulator